MAKESKMNLGIDEAGRGCLAGPVVVGAVAIPQGFKIPNGLPELRDSKKMTSLQRNEWYEWLVKEGSEKGILFSVHAVSPIKLDRINIAQAANLAAWRGFKQISEEIEALDIKRIMVVLDGGLFLKNRRFQKKAFPGSHSETEVRTVIRADSKFTEVMMAATLAKVTRDRKMIRLARKYPEYGFDIHKGYGTRRHIEAIREYGPIEGFHRKTFISRIWANPATDVPQIP
ncbi:MAG: ribonuclease HII [Candidatus Colwellbacteria bacterium]|nr:ribonuclease HII [Candidatus Colwellbacteria bacterium]